jgi:hypothetical protein
MSQISCKEAPQKRNVSPILELCANLSLVIRAGVAVYCRPEQSNRMGPVQSLMEPDLARCKVWVTGRRRFCRPEPKRRLGWTRVASISVTDLHLFCLSGVGRLQKWAERHADSDKHPQIKTGNGSENDSTDDNSQGIWKGKLQLRRLTLNCNE